MSELVKLNFIACSFECQTTEKEINQHKHRHTQNKTRFDNKQSKKNSNLEYYFELDL